MKKIIAQLKNNPLVGAFVVLGAIALWNQPKTDTEVANNQNQPVSQSVDTFIPRGYVLVPIEVANAESLASLIGDMGGVVDLYLAANEQQKSNRKVGSKIKLMKAPRDPQQYAVLVKESESSRLLSYPGPYIAVVQNPDERGTQVTSSTSRTKIRVEYQN